MIEFIPLAMTSSSPPPPALDGRDATAENGVTPDNGGEGKVGDDGKPFRLRGSLFFALPDGGAELYRLEGVAKDPEVRSSMTGRAGGANGLCCSLLAGGGGCPYLRDIVYIVFTQTTVFFLLREAPAWPARSGSIISPSRAGVC